MLIKWIVLGVGVVISFVSPQIGFLLILYALLKIIFV